MSPPKKTNTAPQSNPSQSLTASPKPALDWSRDGTPASDDFDDIYFSTDGGLAETNAVFLDGCHLESEWGKMADGDIFTIGELGFGSGLNFLACIDLWDKTRTGRAANTRLHFISVEAYPWTQADLETALSHWPELAPYGRDMIAQWPGQVRGVHPLHFGSVNLTLFHMKIDSALSNMVARVNAWFLDGFSPSKNPDMWAEPVMEALAVLSAPHARLATFSVAGFVRESLTQNGFIVEKKQGFGRKRHRLEAIYVPEIVGETMSTVKIKPKPVFSSSADISLPPIIIGAGIAGASLALAYQRRGIKPVLIDPCLDGTVEYGASFNPCALVMPRLDLQDRPESRFFNAAYLYAITRYRDTGTVLDTGICHHAVTDKEAARFEKLLSCAALPSGHMKRFVSDKVGDDLTALWFEQALLIDPKATLRTWSQNSTPRAHRVLNVAFDNGQWAVTDQGGVSHTRHLHLCAGANILKLAELAVRFTKGQVCWSPPDAGLTPPHCDIGEGYAAPYQNGVLLGASHHHVDGGEDNHTTALDTQNLVENYRSRRPIDISKHDHTTWQSRASVRVTTKNTLPICCRLGDDKNNINHADYPASNMPYILSGLGSRGFMMAPLLAEMQVAQTLGENLPVARNVLSRFVHKGDVK